MPHPTICTSRPSAGPSGRHPRRRRSRKQDVTTAIHRFDISTPTRTRYRGSGQVSGYLLNQWSLSEYARRPARRQHRRAGMVRLERLDDLVADDASHRCGRTQPDRPRRNLGKGQRVYAVRFVGPAAYVVTFKQVDPLYTIDLSDPARPRVLGELELPGYSAYLHPIGADLLLGIGQDVDDAGSAGRHAVLAVRRLRPPAPDADRPCDARPGLVRGGVRPPRLPLLAANGPRRRAVRPARRGLSRDAGARNPARRPDRAPGRHGFADDHAVGRRRRQRLHDLGLRRRVERSRRPRRTGLGALPGAASRPSAEAGQPVD